jgi:hypothetical protein
MKTNFLALFSRRLCGLPVDDDAGTALGSFLGSALDSVLGSVFSEFLRAGLFASSTGAVCAPLA